MEELAYAKHEVAWLDTTLPPDSVAEWVKCIPGDKGALAFYQDEIRSFQPEVAVHLSASNADEASSFLAAVEDLATHLVVTSNTNVYLAHGRLRQTEPGGSLAVPINEKAPLRSKPLFEESQGDKRDVEAAMARSKRPVTILRMAPLYGPHDYLRRFYPLMVRMIDARPHIFLGSTQADWKWSHAFVGDAAHAVALAATNPAQTHRVFNVAESKTLSMRERIEHIGNVFGWEGNVTVLSEAHLPPYLRVPGDFAQDLEIDSSLIRKELGYKETSDYYDAIASSQRFDYSAEDALASVSP